MKKVLLIVLTLGIGFWGCAEDTNLTGPEKTDVQKSFLKVDEDNFTTSMEKKTVNSIEIDGEKGGIFKFKLKNGKLKAKGHLRFKKGSFKGVKPISVKLVDGLLAFEFSPSIELINPAALLTAEIKGVKLDKNVAKGDYEFVFIDGAEFIAVPYKKIIIDKKHGRLKVVKAELSSFTRYGWTR